LDEASGQSVLLKASQTPSIQTPEVEKASSHTQIQGRTEAAI